MERHALQPKIDQSLFHYWRPVFQLGSPNSIRLCPIHVFDNPFIHPRNPTSSFCKVLFDSFHDCLHSLRQCSRSSMMSPMSLFGRDMGPGPYPDVSKIPTPPLQAVAVAVMFTLPAIGIIVYGLRIYARISMRTLGLGKSFILDWKWFTLTSDTDDLLAGMALVRESLWYLRDSNTN